MHLVYGLQILVTDKGAHHAMLYVDGTTRIGLASVLAQEFVLQLFVAGLRLRGSLHLITW